MILSDKDIRKYIQDTNIPLIEPFSDYHLQAASYDVSMSGNISILKRLGKLIDPADEFDLGDTFENVRIGANGYLFSPGEYLLAELTEKVKIPNNLIAHIRPRTRFTRAGILVADQHCNPTYEGRLHIGLYNIGLNTILLWPGLKIAQILFEELSSVPSEELWYQNKKDAAFHQEDSFRGSIFHETKWTEDEKKLYEKMVSSFDKEAK